MWLLMILRLCSLPLLSQSDHRVFGHLSSSQLHEESWLFHIMEDTVADNSALMCIVSCEALQYINRCVPLQIMSNQLNLVRVTSEMIMCHGSVSEEFPHTSS